MTGRPLRIIIDAQMPGDGSRGGVQQFTASLIHALGQLEDGTEEYIVLGPSRDNAWLVPLIGRNQRLIAAPRPSLGSPEHFKQMLGPVRAPLANLYRKLQVLLSHPLVSPETPRSTGLHESLGADVLHFPHQDFILSDLPTIYNPHDLQHLHFPEFFTRQEIALREVVFREGCANSKAVVTESAWIKEDIRQRYGLEKEKMYAILWGSPTELYEPVTSEMLSETKKKFALDLPFAFYPAQTWPHKNHKRLLDAFALLRQEKGFDLKLVCTGSKNFFWPEIKRHLEELKLGGQVSFPGFVTSVELKALYRLASFMIFPSLFEGGGFPILEAFREGVPVATSTVTSVPEYAGDAVFFFDPNSVESIAKALERMYADPSLREDLAKRGSDRIKLFSWDRTARSYRAIYRKVAGEALSDEEELLLQDKR
ncbi:MAG TPA: glycosyltransferase family 1 protein [Syntrophorhabdales bacterium]|nr:glycosyltransferase family 1 protein [Syntrophorhabdales bacterium]